MVGWDWTWYLMSRYIGIPTGDAPGEAPNTGGELVGVDSFTMRSLLLSPHSHPAPLAMVLVVSGCLSAHHIPQETDKTSEVWPHHALPALGIFLPRAHSDTHKY